MVEERGLRESRLQRAKVEEAPESFQAASSYRRVVDRREVLLFWEACCFGIVTFVPLSLGLLCL